MFTKKCHLQIQQASSQGSSCSLLSTGSFYSFWCHPWGTFPLRKNSFHSRDALSDGLWDLARCGEGRKHPNMCHANPAWLAHVILCTSVTISNIRSHHRENEHENKTHHVRENTWTALNSTCIREAWQSWNRPNKHRGHGVEVLGEPQVHYLSQQSVAVILGECPAWQGVGCLN